MRIPSTPSRPRAPFLVAAPCALDRVKEYWDRVLSPLTAEEADLLEQGRVACGSDWNAIARFYVKTRPGHALKRLAGRSVRTSLGKRTSTAQLAPSAPATGPAGWAPYAQPTVQGRKRGRRSRHSDAPASPLHPVLQQTLLGSGKAQRYRGASVPTSRRPVGLAGGGYADDGGDGDPDDVQGAFSEDDLMSSEDDAVRLWRPREGPRGHDRARRR